jgi:ABC-2 type transport system permease protein
VSAATYAVDSKTADRVSHRRPSFARLTGVELRKMVDTRAGAWLLFGVVALTIVVIVARVFGKHADHTLSGLFVDPLQVPSTFLPVIGILLVTSEWTQRTSLITFTLVPQRLRVLTAKIAAGVILALAGFWMTLGIAAVATPFASQVSGSAVWSLPPWLIGQMTILLIAQMLGGIAFGAALLSSAPAIVLYFLLPLGFVAIGHVKMFEFLARWLDGAHTLAPLGDHALNASEWAHAGATLTTWTIVPLAIGAWRIARSEVS